MNKTFKYHQGFTLITIILILGLIAFFALLIMKIGPIYLDHSKVTNALAAIEKTTDVQQMSEPEIRLALDKRFNMNYVSDLKTQDVKITKRGSYLKVEANYEVVEQIAGNLSVLVHFDDVIEVGEE